MPRRLDQLTRLPWSPPSTWSRATLERLAARGLEWAQISIDATPEQKAVADTLIVSRATRKELVPWAVMGRDMVESENEEIRQNRAEFGE